MAENATLVNDVQILARPYMERKKKFSELNLNDPSDIEIALYCINHKQTLLSELNVKDDSHLNLLKTWVSSGYSNYITLTRNNIYHKDLLDIYLYLKFKKAIENTDEITILRSYKKEIVFYYTYQTRQGETVNYFDNALGVPTYLKTKATIKMKVVDPQNLLKRWMWIFR